MNTNAYEYFKLGKINYDKDYYKGTLLEFSSTIELNSENIEALKHKGQRFLVERKVV